MLLTLVNHSGIERAGRGSNEQQENENAENTAPAAGPVAHAGRSRWFNGAGGGKAMREAGVNCVVLSAITAVAACGTQ
jgi:hypothetical protein